MKANVSHLQASILHLPHAWHCLSTWAENSSEAVEKAALRCGCRQTQAPWELLLCRRLPHCALGAAKLLRHGRMSMK